MKPAAAAWNKLVGISRQILEELKAPPVVAAVSFFLSFFLCLFCLFALLINLRYTLVSFFSSLGSYLGLSRGLGTFSLARMRHLKCLIIPSQS